MLNLKIKRLSGTAKLPTRDHDGDMWDLYADKDIKLNSTESKIIPLGLSFDIPDGYRIKIFSRSSLPLKRQIIVSNSVGVIDTGYKNEIGLICHTLPQRVEIKYFDSHKEAIDFAMKFKLSGTICVKDSMCFIEFSELFNNKILVKKGDKIAQFQLEKIIDFDIQEVTDIDMSNDRGGGFGSTNKE